MIRHPGLAAAFGSSTDRATWESVWREAWAVATPADISLHGPSLGASATARTTVEHAVSGGTADVTATELDAAVSPAVDGSAVSALSAVLAFAEGRGADPANAGAPPLLVTIPAATVDAIDASLATQPLVSVTGPPGAGKTAAAAAVASASGADIVRDVDVHDCPVDDGGHAVAAAIMHAVGGTPVDGASPLARAALRLGGRPGATAILTVRCSTNQVATVTQVSDQLLDAAPGVRVVVVAPSVEGGDVVLPPLTCAEAASLLPATLTSQDVATWTEVAGGRPGVLKLAAVVGGAPVSAAASSTPLPLAARLLASLPAADVLMTLKLVTTLGSVRFTTTAAACVLGSGSATDATLRALPTVDAAAADAWCLSTLVTDAALAVADAAGMTFPSVDGAVLAGAAAVAGRFAALAPRAPAAAARLLDRERALISAAARAACRLAATEPLPPDSTDAAATAAAAWLWDGGAAVVAILGRPAHARACAAARTLAARARDAAADARVTLQGRLWRLPAPGRTRSRC